VQIDVLKKICKHKLYIFLRVFSLRWEKKEANREIILERKKRKNKKKPKCGKQIWNNHFIP
jgi:hypothetical protein